MRIDDAILSGSVLGSSAEVSLSGSFSGSFAGDGSGLTGISGDLTGSFSGDASGSFSGSFSGDGSAMTFEGTEMISGSSQIVSALSNTSIDFGTGVVSGDNFGDVDGSSAFTGSFSGDGSNLTFGGTSIVSGSSQIDITQTSGFTSFSGSASTSRNQLAVDYRAADTALSSSASAARDLISSTGGGNITALSSSASTSRNQLAVDYRAADTVLSGSASTSRNQLAVDYRAADTALSGSSSTSRNQLAVDYRAADLVLSGSASAARDLLSISAISASYAITASYALSSIGGASDYTSIYVTADTTAIADRLYVFTLGTIVTLTLPLSPSNGDSLYVSNRSGIDTNVVARNGELIMGLAQDVTLDVSAASFKLTYAAGSQGWVITGAGGAGLSPGIVSGSSQINITQTSGFTSFSGSASTSRNQLAVDYRAADTALSGSTSTSRNQLAVDYKAADTALSGSTSTSRNQLAVDYKAADTALSGSTSTSRNQLAVDYRAADTALSGSASAARDLLSSTQNYSPSLQSTDFTAVTGRAYIISSSAAAVTMSLPTTPQNGDSIKFANMDGRQTLIDANGNKIMSRSENMTLDVPASSFELIYETTFVGWTIIGSRGI